MLLGYSQWLRSTRNQGLLKLHYSKPSMDPERKLVTAGWQSMKQLPGLLWKSAFFRPGALPTGPPATKSGPADSPRLTCRKAISTLSTTPPPFLTLPCAPMFFFGGLPSVSLLRFFAIASSRASSASSAEAAVSRSRKPREHVACPGKNSAVQKVYFIWHVGRHFRGSTQTSTNVYVYLYTDICIYIQGTRGRGGGNDLKPKPNW